MPAGGSNPEFPVCCLQIIPNTDEGYLLVYCCRRTSAKTELLGDVSYQLASADVT